MDERTRRLRIYEREREQEAYVRKSLILAAVLAPPAILIAAPVVIACAVKAAWDFVVFDIREGRDERRRVFLPMDR